MTDEKPKSKLLQFLEEGGDDDGLVTTVKLFEELKAAAERKDREAVTAAVRKLTAIADDLEAQKKELRDALKEACQRAFATADPDERTEKLLTAFQVAAKAKPHAYERLDDKETGDEAVRRAYDIVIALDEIPPGRRIALAKFLDNPDPAVQVLAAVHLRKILADRALPILRAINEKYAGTDVGMTAFWGLAFQEADERDAAKREKEDSNKG